MDSEKIKLMRQQAMIDMNVAAGDKYPVDETKLTLVTMAWLAVLLKYAKENGNLFSIFEDTNAPSRTKEKSMMTE